MLSQPVLQKLCLVIMVQNALRITAYLWLPAFHITMHLSRLMKMYLLHLKSLLMRLSLQTSLRLYITEKLLTLVRRDLFSIT